MGHQEWARDKPKNTKKKKGEKIKVNAMTTQIVREITITGL